MFEIEERYYDSDTKFLFCIGVGKMPTGRVENYIGKCRETLKGLFPNAVYLPVSGEEGIKLIQLNKTDSNINDDKIDSIFGSDVEKDYMDDPYDTLYPVEATTLEFIGEIKNARREDFL